MLPAVPKQVFSLRGVTLDARRDKQQGLAKLSLSPHWCVTLDNFPYLPDTDPDPRPLCHKGCDLEPTP